MRVVGMISKIGSLINGASNNYLCHSSENMKENLSFLRKELLAKDAVVKSLLETQTAILNSISNATSKPVSTNLSPPNCSIQDEEQEMENKVDKNKYIIKQLEQKR